MATSDFNIINDNYSWLAERNGIAIATISNEQLILNSHSMLLFDIDKAIIKLEDLKDIISNFSGFENFLDTISVSGNIYQFSISTSGTNKKYQASGIMDAEKDLIYLTFQPLNSSHTNAEYLCQYATYSNDTYLILSEQTEILFLNQNFEKLFERDREELKGNPMKIIEWIDERDLPFVEQFVNEIKQEIVDKWYKEFRINLPNGGKKWVSVVKKAIYDGNGTIYRYIAIFSDISQRKNIENELLESELNYREIYNATNDAIIIHNAETGKIEDVNNPMLEIFGITYKQALAFGVEKLSANVANYTEEHALELLHQARIKPQVFEWLSRKNNGETFWAEISLRRAEIHGETKIIAVVRDITERKKALELISENEGKYKLIVEGQNELIVRLNSNKKILFASPSFLKVFNLSDEEIIGQEFASLADNQEDNEYLTLALDKINTPPHSGFFEFKVATKNGSRWYSWNYSGIKNSASDSVDIICVGRDITYQKMVESALRESEDRFRSIVQHLSDVVFLIDENANIKYVTPSCEQYLGINVEELLGDNILNFIHNDDKWFAEENITLHLEGSDYNLPYEIRIKHKTDKWKTFEAKSQNMLNHPSVNSIVFTISDITERKLMEKQVLDAIIKTEEKERERFAKDLHDDLGPLLSSIKLYVGMLKKAEQKEKREFIIENLQEIVKEAITTTKDVSNDLNPHVLNNYGLTSALKLFIEKLSVDLDITFNEELGDSRYSTAIELSLYRISKELINNTLKHAEASKINLHIWEKGSQLNLEFEDNGKGLPAEALKANKPGGMGLSNIISRSKSLNAKSNFHTNLKTGFKFEMQVPLVQE